MNWPIGIAIYLTVWWKILFAVLPWGVRSQEETDAIVPGTEPGAPVSPLLIKKAIATTVVAAIVFAGIWWAMENVTI